MIAEVDLPVDCYPMRVPWTRLMTELRQFGWTPYRVADEWGIDKPTAYGWEKGKEPSGMFAAALINLHRHVCGDEYSLKLNKEFRPR